MSDESDQHKEPEAQDDTLAQDAFYAAPIAFPIVELLESREVLFFPVFA